MVSKASVIGIDLGSATSFVSFVGKGLVDIVQNEVSKRDTPSIVGFTDRERLLGDAALSLIKSNAKNSCRNFKHLMGQNTNSPYVEKEHFWSTSKIVVAEDGHPGYEVMYKGEQRTMSAAQVCAMMLTKLREVTEKWTEGKVADCVIGVPSYFSDVHRQAILDAAKIANVSVLRLMNEHTATALAYGIYRSNDFDPEKPMTVAFCSMGHTIFSVSVVQFVRGKLTCLCEKSDKVGGRDMDECLMREFAAQFQKKFGCDPLSNKKAAFKLEDAVTKTKKILSANSNAGVNCECLMEDEDFASEITRDIFLSMCQPMMDKVQAVLDAAKAACGLTMDQIDAVEIVGGATRVPWVKEMCSKAFGGKELSTTMNADESVARGCALQAAIQSPLYKVRDFVVNDFSPHAVSIGWTGTAADAEAKTEEEADTQHMAAAEGEYKTATLFPAGSAMNTFKLLTFHRKGPFEIKAEYVDESLLIPGTSKCLGIYKVDIPPQSEPKKVKVKAHLTIHGTFTISSAQIVETEEYEDTRKEKREVEPTPEEIAKAEEATAAAEAAPAAEGAPPAEGAEGDKKEEKKEPEKKAPEKKYEWVDVTKKKTRTKHTDVPVIASGVPGLPSSELQKRMDEESAMQADMADIIELDEKRNDLESYIFNMRDKTSSSGKYGEFITEADRQIFHTNLTKMEDWLYDAEGPTKVMYVEKLNELKVVGDPVVWRFKESEIREEWSAALTGTISNYKTAAQNPGEKYGHISPDKLGKVVAECDKTSAWLKDLQAKQEGMAKHERPILVCADMDQKNKDLAQFADDVLKEPKPKPPEPPKEDKTEDKKEAAKEGDKNEGDAPADEAKKDTGAADVD